MTDLAAKYRLQRALSWTAAARTFAGQCPDTGKRVVVKVMSLTDESHREALTRRFDSTASVLQALGHPALPDVLDYGVTPGGEAYLVTAWFAGARLSELDLDPGDVLHVTMQVVEALESLALHGLVHLSIAPENVLVSPDQSVSELNVTGQRAQLTGWGSSLLNVDWQSGQGVIVRSPNSFTAPELASAGGIGEALWRADLYSVAAMVIELLGAEVVATPGGGQVRFSGELSQQISRPEALRAMLQSCLQRDPDARPDAYSALVRALQHSMPRERLPDVTATQPMHALRAGIASAAGLSGAGGGSGVVTDETVLSSRVLPPPEPMLPPVKKAESLPSETGVHAIRQETGAFVLPKSSSEKSAPGSRVQEPLFEANELGRMVEDLAEENLLDSTGSRKEEAGSVPPLPDLPSDPDRPSVPSVGEQVLPLGEILRTHGSKDSADESSQEPGPVTTAEVALPNRAELAKVSEGEEKHPVKSEPTVVASEAETLWAAPEELGALVSEARQRGEQETLLPPQRPLAGDREDSSEAVESSSDARTRKASADSPSKGPTPRKERDISEESKRREAREAVALVAMMRAKSAAEESGTDSSGVDSSDRDSSDRDSSDVAHLDADSLDASTSSVAPLPEKRAAENVTREPREKRRWSPLILGLAAGVLLILLLGASLVFGLLRDKQEEPSQLSEFPRVVEAVVVPEEAPLFRTPVEIDQAMALIEEENWTEARKVLDAFAAQFVSVQEVSDQEDLSDENPELRVPLRAEHAEALFAAREALELAQGAQIKERLAPALVSMDVNAIRLALRGGTPALTALRRQPDGAELAGKARNLLRRVDAFRSALDRGDGAEPLERALDLEKAYPDLAGRLNAVDRAIKRVEQVALELADGGRLGEASLLLHAVGERAELSERMATLQRRIDTQLTARSRVTEVLRDADSFGQSGAPHRGLELLAAANPQPEDRERYLALRARLQKQLAELDADSPELDLIAQGLDLRRGEPLIVQLMVVDDYEVIKVSFRLLANGQEVREMPVRAQGEGLYSVQIPAGVHQGKPIQFWAVAADRSGHRGNIGSQGEPIEIRRKRWFQVFRRGSD